LAAVQGLVHQNNGVVTIDSRPGDGTTVTVMLPANGHDPAEVVARD
jgi:signal transduction histidine kinase